MKSIFKKNRLLLTWLITTTVTCVAQDTIELPKKSNSFFQFELGWAEENINDPVFYDYNESKDPWFLEQGLLINIGYGFHYNQWVGFGLFSGFDWRATTKMVSVPLHGSVFLNPKISNNISIYAQASYGRIFLIDDKIITGVYRKGKLGVIVFENGLISLEYGNYKLMNETKTEIDFISFCLAYMAF